MMIPQLLNQNQQFSEIIEICKKIYQDGNAVQIFKWRCIRLSNRVNSIKHATTTRYYNSGGNRDNKLASYQLLLYTCLEDVHEHLKRYLRKDDILARLLIKNGTMEEDFVKLNERLVHCVDELQLPLIVNEIFNPSDDTEDFLKDIDATKTNIKSLMMIQDKQESDKNIDAFCRLVETQKKERDSYKSKRLPNAKINIELADLKFDKIVGKGGFGTVWKGRFRREIVAIKKLQNITDPTAIEDFRQEANIMRRISHQRTVNCFGVCESNEMFCMVLEYCEEGSLNGLINYKQSLESNWALRKSIALDIVIGMRYLHRLRIVHRDLKSANVLLDKKFGAKIADFGLSVLKNTTVSVIKMAEEGTTQYMAPECFGIAPTYSSKSDVFAFSIILWELAHWKMAYNGVHRAEVKDSIGRLGIRLDISKRVPTDIITIIKQSWDQSPLSRPNFSEIFDALEHSDIEHITDYPSESDTSVSNHFTTRVNADQLKILLSSQRAITPPLDSFTPVSEGIEITENADLKRFWHNLTADAAELSWEHFFDHVSLFLDMDNPNELDTESLRKKIDPRGVLTVPTLSRLMQIIQERKPKVFFSRFVKQTSVHGRNKSFSDVPAVIRSVSDSLAKNKRSNSTSQSDLISPSNVIPFPISYLVKRSNSTSPLRTTMNNGDSDDENNETNSKKPGNGNDIVYEDQNTIVKVSKHIANGIMGNQFDATEQTIPKPYDFQKKGRSTDNILNRARSNASSDKLKSKFSIKRVGGESDDGSPSTSEQSLSRVNSAIEPDIKSKFSIRKPLADSELDSANLKARPPPTSSNSILEEVFHIPMKPSKSMDSLRKGSSIRKPLHSKSSPQFDDDSLPATEVVRPPVDEDKWRELQPSLPSKPTVSKSNPTLISKSTISRSKPTISKSPASLASKPTISKSPVSQLSSKPTVSKSPASLTSIPESAKSGALKSNPTVSKPAISTVLNSTSKSATPPPLKSSLTKSKSDAVVPSSQTKTSNPDLAPTHIKASSSASLNTKSKSGAVVAFSPNNVLKGSNSALPGTHSKSSSSASSILQPNTGLRPATPPGSNPALRSKSTKLRSESSLGNDQTISSKSKPVISNVEDTSTPARLTRFGTLRKDLSENQLLDKPKPTVEIAKSRSEVKITAELSKSKSDVKIDRTSKSSKTSSRKGNTLNELKKSASAGNIITPKSPFDNRRKSGDSLAQSLEVVVEVDPADKGTGKSKPVGPFEPKAPAVKATPVPVISSNDGKKPINRSNSATLAKILLAFLILGIAAILIYIFVLNPNLHYSILVVGDLYFSSKVTSA